MKNMAKVQVVWRVVKVSRGWGKKERQPFASGKLQSDCCLRLQKSI